MSDPFHFTVSDAARFIGKSAVTVRGWERRGDVILPRDPNGDRRFYAADIRKLALTARSLGRINEQRLNYVEAAVTLLEIIEQENLNAQYRTHRSA